MNWAIIVGLIFLATLLETGGDSIIRFALGVTNSMQRLALFAIGATLLFGYGFSLVSAPLDFGRLFGLYIAILFIVAQIMNALFFKTLPTLPVCVGGLFIIVGGILVTCWNVKSS